MPTGRSVSPADEEIVKFAIKKGVTPAQLLSRSKVRAAACPKCGALPGQNCMGVRRLREANHMERVMDAVRAMGIEVVVA